LRGTCEDVPHDSLRILQKMPLRARHEGAIGNEAVERIAHECEFEEAAPFLGA